MLAFIGFIIIFVPALFLIYAGCHPAFVVRQNGIPVRGKTELKIRAIVVGLGVIIAAIAVALAS